MGTSEVYFPIPPLTDHGDLPRGRFCASLDDVEKRFVTDAAYDGSNTREQIWSDFNDLVELIKRIRVRVPAAFIGGSFVTDKLDPSDVDVAFLVDTSRITNPNTYGQLQQRVADPKANNGLQVDSFLIPWHPDGSELGGNHPSYAIERSRWDDFWQRKVALADRIPHERSHAMPVRGYVEVIIDGYS